MDSDKKAKPIEGLTSLVDVLDRLGIREEVEANSIKRIVALELQNAMREQRLSKASLAKRMRTSRSQLDRVLDPDAHNVTLETLARAARIVGKRLQVELV